MSAPRSARRRAAALVEAGAGALLALAASSGTPRTLAAAPAPPPALPASTPGPHAGLRVGFIERFTGKPAPPFALQDLQGATIRLAAYRGKVVLLNFWYSTCIPCRKETPDLIALYRAYKDHGFAVLAINLDAVMMPQARGEALRTFLTEFPIPYPVLIADQQVYDAYGQVPVQPISFLVGRDGVVVRVFWGAFSGAFYEKTIRPLLATPGAQPALPSGGGARPS